MARRGRVIWLLLATSLLVGLVTHRAQAQDFKRQFKIAKDLYLDGKYNLSMEAFKPLMVYDKENPYYLYSGFYFALSAFHQNYLALAKENFLQLRTNNPDWEQSDEVKYWLGVIYFQQGETFQAMSMLQSMQSPRDWNSIEALKNKYLNQISDEGIIELLLEEYPTEVVLQKKQVLNALKASKYDKARALVASYGLEPRLFNIPEKPATVFKDRYRVSLLFPFMMATLDPSPGQKRNQSTLDLYQGIQLAVDSLKTLDINVELRSYDTNRSPETVAQIISQEELKSSDVILGPLFTDELPLVRDFAKAHAIPMVNPVSSSRDFVDDNDNTLLLFPDAGLVGRYSAEALKERNLKKPCVVFIGDTPRDSVMGVAFLEKAREIGLKVAHVQYVNKATSNDVFSVLVTPTRFDRFGYPVEYRLKRDSISSVFVASDNDLIFTKVISSVDRRADSVIIAGHYSWLDKPAMEFDKFERLHIMMAAPGFMDLHAPAMLQFQRQYKQRFGLMPTTFAAQGFEAMMLLGKSFRKNGTDFFSSLKQESSVEGTLSSQYKFLGGQINQHLSFVIFNDGALEVLK